MKGKLHFLLVFLMYIMSLFSVFGQVDHKKIFKKMKKYEGTWLSLQKDGSFLMEEWKIGDKNHIQIAYYQINAKDSTKIWEGSFYYSKFIRFVHTSSVHLSIDSVHHKNLTYSWILDSFSENQLTFQNFNNPFPNKIIYDLSKKTEIRITFVSKDAKEEKTFVFQKNQKK